jgi:hypothetical protein
MAEVVAHRLSHHIRFGHQNKTRVEAVSKSSIALLYQKTSKERSKGHPPTPTNLAIYSIHLAPSCDLSWVDVPSKSNIMISCTANTHHISTTMPHRLTSQHLRPLPSHSKYYRHHYQFIPHYLRVIQGLGIFVTPLPLCFPNTDHLFLICCHS